MSRAFVNLCGVLLLLLAATQQAEARGSAESAIAMPATAVTPVAETTVSDDALPSKAQPAAVNRDSVLNPGTDNNSAMTLTKIVISLALVILLVLGLGWMFKKLSLRMPGNRQIKVICALPLGQRERILVIEIQGKQRVIGVTPQQINLLFELENPLPEEKLASDFHTQLQSFLKK